jgi:hypothetical protein
MSVVPVGRTGGGSLFYYHQIMKRYLDTDCTYTEEYEPEHTYTFKGTCRVTHKEHSVKVLGSELFRFRKSDSIYSLESVSRGDREFLISGISPKGWNQLVNNV